jgi:hypothetical protein
MLCTECGCIMKEVTKSYHARSLLAGTVELFGVKQWECNCQECTSVYIDFETAKRVEDCVLEKERALIDALPIGEFVTGIEAAEILGITKQGFSKNQRIRNGFIVSKRMDGRIFYYRPSVVAFAGPKKDGRINLTLKNEAMNNPKYQSPILAFAGEESYQYASPGVAEWSPYNV